ncbi:anoctamin-9 isoform X1 [Esox lucius]|uniref:Anoctamin n=1 Tax=Esox lucius TaxID=8010 RepID=A0A3P8Z0C1_ESOLU|nr:anoctamin-9 isoform X1 [Esox lucius]
MSRHRRQASIELLELMGVVQENGCRSESPESPSLPPLRPSLSYDYVLVGKVKDDKKKMKLQEAFIHKLKEKNLNIKRIEDDSLVFYGIQAPKEVFEKYRYLLRVSDACNWSEQQETVPLSTRIRIVHYILNHVVLDTKENLWALLNKGVFEAKFCLHERESQKDLTEKWARWTAIHKGQPIDNIRNYFGEKVALYFLWLGWYTLLLVPAAIVGIIVFLYGLAFFNTSPLIKEVCESETVMCPLCDKRCKVWQLSDTCLYAKVSLLFDNEGTVMFAMFMAVWATVFLEFWMRHRASYTCEWKVFDWCEEEEELILDIVSDPDCRPKEHKHSYLRSTAVLIMVTLMLLLIIGLAQGLVLFRVFTTVKLAEGKWDFLSDNANTVAMMLGAVIHFLTITVMTKVNKIVSQKLCAFEETQSFAAHERSFTIKMFTFQFFTLFSSLFYVAFFLGRINGHPGGYVRLSGKWRLEECHPSGCLTDLFIQMAIIMVLKQTFSNVVEFGGPWFNRWLRKHRTETLERTCSQRCHQNTNPGARMCDDCKLDDWLRNYRLNDVDSFSLFNEFLEMVIQFSFTTIFVAAFPLAPLLALINNVFEIRLDAIKMVSLERRLVPKKTNHIGVWTEVLQAIGVLAVIANGLVIGITSDFIPRLVYRYVYGPCANGTVTDVDCMAGYINSTLSVANMTDENIIKDFSRDQMVTHSGQIVFSCSYKDYRNNTDHSLTSQFWLILAVRFAFVILFEHVVVIFKFITAWFVPSVPLDVKNKRLIDKLDRLKEELRSSNV